MKRGSIIPHHMLLHNIITSQLADTDLGPGEDSSETRMLLRLSTIFAYLKKKQCHNKHIWLVVEPTHLNKYERQNGFKADDGMQ